MTLVGVTMSSLMAPDQRDALLALTLTPGVGPVFVRQVRERLGSAAAVRGASAKELAAAVDRLSVERAGKLLRAIDEAISGGAVATELEKVAEHGAMLVGLDDDNYPKLLRHISDPPPLLWARGELREDDALSLGVVGSRRCTHYGREQAGRFSRQAAQAGLCVVSGGAYGIDAAAHQGALDAGGRTIAVLGSGLARPYPKEHVGLFGRIAEAGAGHGAVISELPMSTPPSAENFPRRNRIVSGLSLGVLVVEAADRSGALITARLCVEDHGRELLAVPGRVDSPTSDGCHRMIREGWAKLATNIADVLDSLGEAGQLLKASMGPSDSEKDGEQPAEGVDVATAKFSEVQTRILKALDEPRSLEELAASTSLPVSRLQAELTMLELRAAVSRQRGQFARRS